ncbi:MULTISPECIES: beta-lactamase hydrolase domain-containing protein [Noviherbaspirillum]|jgi:uncharacterized protein (TIGR01244 family)|uniref:Sulfur transferase domain-containing protein n=1 Tax=Noviherbaspirillum album TaxID=3080276 RepID=A0ABU6J3Z7_9BURK|nr:MULTISPECIES: sulfur transferase domain-containing protein [Noviherbaspirillum]MEC4718358.1 sulfur transferase domain-containing protein [Noviherbaspirillum sp. CPCC 100848]
MDRFKQLEDSMLLGPQPTEQDLEQAKQLGIKTVIDFRLPSETPMPNAEVAARCGLGYANILVNKASLSKEQIDELDRVMREKEGPFLIHCASGARAAMLLALSRAKKNNWTAERTFEEARSMGFDLQTSPEFAKFVVEATTK